MIVLFAFNEDRSNKFKIELFTFNNDQNQILVKSITTVYYELPYFLKVALARSCFSLSMVIAELDSIFNKMTITC